MKHIELAGVIVLAAVVTGVTAGATPIAAGQTTDSVLGDVLDGPAANESTSAWALDGARTGATAFVAGLEGGRERAAWMIYEQVGLTDETNASAAATEVQTVWNANNATLDAYASDRRDWESNQTVEIAWHVDGETATRYLLANASNGSVETRMVAETNRTPTESVDVCGYAAEESPEELRTFVDDYAEPGADVGPAYKARLGSKYGDDVAASLYPTSGECSASTNMTNMEANHAW